MTHWEYPCPCGYFGDDHQQCTCSPGAVSRYQKRISGPILDRIDIHLEVQRVPCQKLAALEGGDTSATIRTHVEAARRIQQARFASLGKPNVLVNGDMGPAERQFCALDKQGLAMLRMAVERMGLSVRAHHRILKLARTIADLAGSEQVQQAHFVEALQYPTDLRVLASPPQKPRLARLHQSHSVINRSRIGRSRT